MWFDPTAIAQASPPPATLAQRTGEDAPRVAEVAEVAAPLCRDKETTSYCWLIHLADREPLTVAFSPAVSHAEVLASYPSALAAEPIEPGRRQPDTRLAGDQEAAIRAWLAQIGESDEAIIDEVLTRCRMDEVARVYYLGRVDEILRLNRLFER